MTCSAALRALPLMLIAGSARLRRPFKAYRHGQRSDCQPVLHHAGDCLLLRPLAYGQKSLLRHEEEAQNSPLHFYARGDDFTGRS